MALVINGKNIHFEGAHQILNMGGPWISNLYEGDFLITDKGLLDNLIVDLAKKRFFFVRYHRISKWAKDNFFTINFYNIIKSEIYEYENKFDMLFLGKIINEDMLEIYHAFHDKFPEKRLYFDLKNEPFHLVH